MAFSQDQPKHGETILHCGHAARGAHWFRYETPLHFERPDKSQGDAAWLAICPSCFMQHGADAPVRGDGQWTGDEPVIETEDN